MPAAIDEQIIFDAALKVLTERGYVGATTKLIAQEADIGEVTLFRRFGNKDTLIKEAVRREAGKFGGSDATFYTGDLEADLVRVTTFYHRLMQARVRFILTYLTEVTRQPELGEVLEAPLAVYSRIIDMLERYQDEGKLKRMEPLQQLSVLFGPILMGNIIDKIGLMAGTFDAEAHVRGFLEGQAT